MNREKLNINGSFKVEFLETASLTNELMAVGEKRGLKLPSPDFGIFKCIFAMADEENKNGCTLPTEEVEKSLDTLVGKAIDVDHWRTRTIGTWLDKSFNKETKEIIAYGAIWKNNFPDEYEEAKNLAEKGALRFSFEAWGDRNYRANTQKKSYTLHNIEFAGGALLLKEKPAFDKARSLEFSSVLNQEEILEEVQEEVMDIPVEIQLAVEAQAKEQPVEESKTLTYKQRQDLPDDMFAVVIEKDGKKVRKFPIKDENHVRAALSRLGQEVVVKKLEVLGLNKEDVLKKVLKRAEELNMTELLKKYQKANEEVVAVVEIKDSPEATLQKEEPIIVEESKQVEPVTLDLSQNQPETTTSSNEVSTVTLTVQSQEEVVQPECTQPEEPTIDFVKLVEELKKQLEEKQLEIESLTGKIQEFEAKCKNKDEELSQLIQKSTEQVEQAKVAIKLVTERRIELGEYAQNLKDEELLDDNLYTVAKLERENLKLKFEKSNISETPMEVGTKIQKSPDKAFEIQRRINKYLQSNGR